MTRRRPLAVAIERTYGQQGFGLLGLIVALGLSVAVVGVAYVAYGQASTTADAKSAAASSAEIAAHVRTSYASAATFASLNQNNALCDGVFPPSSLVSVSGTMACPGASLPAKATRNPWGGSIQLTGTASGFALTYENVAPAACTRFVSSAATGWDDVTVNGHSVLSGRAVLPAAAAVLCSQSSTAVVQFLGSKAAGATGLPTLTPCVPPAPQTQAVACPAGQLSSVAPYSVDGVTQQRTGFCNGAYGLPGWSPWTMIGSTCTPSCVSQLAGLVPNPATQGQTVPGSIACPGGQTGSDTWQQAQTQTRTASCVGTPVDPPTWGAWSAWVNVGPKLGEVNTCAPTCATRLGVAPWLPNPATQTQNVPGSVACPAGQVGTDTWQQKQTQSRTASCAVPGAAVDPVWGAWSAWVNVGGKIGEVNTCAPACVAPPASTTTQTLGCPIGQAGAINQQQITTYSCPSPTGAAVATPGPWTTTSTTCAPICGPAPVPGSQTLACPPPQTGAITQTHGWVSAAAPTCWTASAWTTTGNTCVTPPPPVSGVTMCALAAPPSGGGAQGTTCAPGSSVTAGYMSSTPYLLECVWRGTVTAGGTSASFTFDKIMNAPGGTTTQTQTVGGKTVTFSVVFSTAGCSGSVN